MEAKKSQRRVVWAAIVTYNRLELLKKCIQAVRGQSSPPDEIVVVNNGSTDGTETWLASQPDLRVITQANAGGAGGFYTAILTACNGGADWIWTMDDDTFPRSGALAELLSAVDGYQLAGRDSPHEPLGWVCSAAFDKAGKFCIMTCPAIDGAASWVYGRDGGFYVRCRHCSFVSALLSAAAVRQVGLPIREFFIWSDDLEYTLRITRDGFAGIYAAGSVVDHWVESGHTSDLTNVNESNLFKFRCAWRNQVVLFERLGERERGNFLRCILRYCVHTCRSLIRSGRWRYVGCFLRAVVEGLRLTRKLRGQERYRLDAVIENDPLAAGIGAVDIAAAAQGVR